jgi:hypothetical protein
VLSRNCFCHGWQPIVVDRLLQSSPRSTAYGASRRSRSDALTAELTAHSARRIERNRVHVDVIVLRILDDREDEIAIGADAAATRTARTRWCQSYDDGTELRCRPSVNVRTGCGQRDVRNRQLEAHLFLARIQRERSRAGAVRVTRPRYLRRASERGGEWPPTVIRNRA